MERALPATAQAEMNKPETGEDFLVFLSIDHPTLAESIRVVTDPKNFVLNGETFIGFYYEITLLTDTESMPSAQISIQTVDRKVSDALQQLKDPAEVKLELIAASEFDLTVDPRTELTTATRIYTADHLFLIDVKGDGLSVTGRLVSWNFTQEPYPGMFATQDRFPGLFR